MILNAMSVDISYGATQIHQTGLIWTKGLTFLCILSFSMLPYNDIICTWCINVMSFRLISQNHKRN